MSIVNTSSKTESVLDKKHKYIAYHATMWYFAACVMRTAWIDTRNNLVDVLTKLLSFTRRNKLFVGDWIC